MTFTFFELSYSIFLVGEKLPTDMLRTTNPVASTTSQLLTMAMPRALNPCLQPDDILALVRFGELGTE